MRLCPFFVRFYHYYGVSLEFCNVCVTAQYFSIHIFSWTSQQGSASGVWIFLPQKNRGFRLCWSLAMGSQPGLMAFPSWSPSLKKEIFLVFCVSFICWQRNWKDWGGLSAIREMGWALRLLTSVQALLLAVRCWQSLAIKLSKAGIVAESLALQGLRLRCSVPKSRVFCFSWSYKCFATADRDLKVGSQKSVRENISRFGHVSICLFVNSEQ